MERGKERDSESGKGGIFMPTQRIEVEFEQKSAYHRCEWTSNLTRGQQSG